MEFSLHIESGDAAFSNGEGVGEVARLLRMVADAIERGTRGAPLFDTNGNRCGRFDMKEDGDE